MIWAWIKSLLDVPDGLGAAPRMPRSAPSDMPVSPIPAPPPKIKRLERISLVRLQLNILARLHRLQPSLYVPLNPTEMGEASALAKAEEAVVLEFAGAPEVTLSDRQRKLLSDVLTALNIAHEHGVRFYGRAYAEETFRAVIDQVTKELSP